MTDDHRDPRVRMSKTLTWILRHHAAEVGIELSEDGFASVDALLALSRLRGLDVPTLRQIVAECPKQRFKLMERDGKLFIRANQGHSITTIKAEALLKPITDAAQAPVAVHGTYSRFWSSILSTGLSKGSRNHVHFSKGLVGDDSVISGMRGNCDVFIFLDVPKALAAGLPLFLSDNGVILSPGFDGIVPMALIAKAVTRGGAVLYTNATAPTPAGSDTKVDAPAGASSPKLSWAARAAAGAPPAAAAAAPGSPTTTTTTATAATPRGRRHIAVLDFEATCEENVRISQQEIIEFPIVMLDADTCAVVDEFHEYCRPLFNPKLSAFCTRLTGIQQATVDAADAFSDVLGRVVAWLHDKGYSGNCTFVTCGFWDLSSMLPAQCRLSNLPVPDDFRSCVNVKVAFEALTGSPARGMTEMLDKLGLPLVGHHHSGIDDCRNIAACVRELKKRHPTTFDAAFTPSKTRGGRGGGGGGGGGDSSRGGGGGGGTGGGRGRGRGRGGHHGFAR